MTYMSLYQIVTIQNHSRRNGSTWVTEYPSFRSTAAREKTDGPSEAVQIGGSALSWRQMAIEAFRKVRIGMVGGGPGAGIAELL